MLLPPAEEHDWLAHSLRKLFAQHDRSLLDSAPCVTPTDDWFPEIWEPTAAHSHLLTQRLMQHAGLASWGLRLESSPLCTASVASGTSRMLPRE
jgi:hypothetical protein